MSTLTKDQQAKLDIANAKATAATGLPRYHISTEGEPDTEASAVDAKAEADEIDEATKNAPTYADSSKFVNLVDLLPPLPQKGHFDVNTIKKSLYFFS